MHDGDDGVTDDDTKTHKYQYQQCYNDDSNGMVKITTTIAVLVKAVMSIFLP